MLQLIGHEEGRMRPVLNSSGVFTSMAFDYFLKDHLGNIRAVVTDELQADVYPTATLEGTGTGSPVEKEKTYYDINSNYVVPKPSGAPVYANDNGTNNPNTFGNPNTNSQQMYQINSSNRTGLGMVLKVMAGDKLDVLGKSYYEYSSGTVSNTPFTAADLIGAFLGSGSSNPAVTHGATSSALNSNTGGTVNPLNAFSNGNPANVNNNVKAGICYILFDEQFKFVSGGFDPVNSAQSGGIKPHFLQNIVVPKNGYIYMYCSNESSINVFFDNFEVVHTRGALLEETHYYPFGLVIAGISSKAAGKVENKRKFNSIEQNNDFDINTYDAFYRTNDPQIGRWWQIDPKGESFFGLTPYNSMGNNPVKFNDPLGDIFDEDSQKIIDALKKGIETRKKELNSERADLKRKIATAKKAGDKGAVKSLKGQLKENTAMNSEMNTASYEISRMESDKQLFMVKEFSGDDPFANGALGVTTYSKDNQAVMIGFKTERYDALIHEMKHGYDFLAGEMSFIPSGTFDISNPLTYFNKPEDRISSLHDMKDEYRAYDREGAFYGVTVDHKKVRDLYYSQGYTLPDDSKNINNTVPPKREIVYKTQKN